MNVERYALMGNPVTHSLSPEIHRLFATQCQHSIIYEKIFVPHSEFAQALSAFIERGGKGLNVTLPFKQQALQCVDQLTPRAQAARAVNTISIAADKTTIGDNTDGVGFINDLKQQQISVTGKKILLLGAGGAARGLVEPLLQQQPALLHIANRTANKAQQLATIAKPQFVTASSLATIPQHDYALIINATASSLQDQVPDISSSLISQQTITYDLFYSKASTPFQNWSQAHGAQQSFDGFGMLIEQAAESFYQWRNIRPNTRLAFNQIKKVFIEMD